MQESVAIQNAQLDAITTTIGASARCRLYTGAAPANCAAAATGTLLVDIACPASYMNAASGGTKTLLGTWQANASAAGTIGYYRIYESTATTCGLQGPAAMSAAEMLVDNTSVTIGQQVTVTAFTITAGNS